MASIVQGINFTLVSIFFFLDFFLEILAIYTKVGERRGPCSPAPEDFKRLFGIFHLS